MSPSARDIDGPSPQVQEWLKAVPTEQPPSPNLSVEIVASADRVTMPPIFDSSNPENKSDGDWFYFPGWDVATGFVAATVPPNIVKKPSKQESECPSAMRLLFLQLWILMLKVTQPH